MEDTRSIFHGKISVLILLISFSAGKAPAQDSATLKSEFSKAELEDIASRVQEERPTTTMGSIQYIFSTGLRKFIKQVGLQSEESEIKEERFLKLYAPENLSQAPVIKSPRYAQQVLDLFAKECSTYNTSQDVKISKKCSYWGHDLIQKFDKSIDITDLVKKTNDHETNLIRLDVEEGILRLQERMKARGFDKLGFKSSRNLVVSLLQAYLRDFLKDGTVRPVIFAMLETTFKEKLDYKLANERDLKRPYQNEFLKNTKCNLESVKLMIDNGLAPMKNDDQRSMNARKFIKHHKKNLRFSHYLMFDILEAYAMLNQAQIKNCPKKFQKKTSACTIPTNALEGCRKVTQLLVEKGMDVNSLRHNDLKFAMQLAEEIPDPWPRTYLKSKGGVIDKAYLDERLESLVQNIDVAKDQYDFTEALGGVMILTHRMTPNQKAHILRNLKTAKIKYAISTYKPLRDNMALMEQKLRYK